MDDSERMYLKKMNDACKLLGLSLGYLEGILMNDEMTDELRRKIYEATVYLRKETDKLIT